MPQSRTTKRLAPDASALKALITTTSLVVTLGGWAVLAVEQPTTRMPDTTIADAMAIQERTSGLELRMAPLPTIVQPPAPPSIVIAGPPAATMQSVTHRAAIQAAPEPSAHALPAVAPLPPQAASPAVNLPLRVVSAPPKPVARTRSSR